MTIYIITPANFKTGGCELSHQLAKTYNDNGYTAIIAYVGVEQNRDPVEKEFKKYIKDWVNVEQIDEKCGDIIIIPEIYPEYIKRFEKAKTVVWWMSVDNYKKYSGGFKYSIEVFGVKKTTKLLIRRKIHNYNSILRMANYHAYQSEYARLFLSKNGITNLIPLSDYINDSYFIDYQDSIREDYVLYNPKKGIDFTKKLMYKFPDYMWIPIENMTTQEVGELLRKSKVYIDFGNHPGKDRFPREAAISGCCVITGMRGSAGNPQDVYIPQDYKFPDKISSIPLIGAKIKDCIENYDMRIKDFKEYQDRIRHEKEKFEADAINLIQMIRGDTEADGKK